jgi:hypothetical protein
LTTGSFIIKIGNDYSVYPSSATITFQPASFSSCAITFNPTQVNTTSNMIITIKLTTSLPRNGSINVLFPLQWVHDLSTNHVIPIDGTLTCVIQDFTGISYLSGLDCFGSLSNNTVTINPTYVTSSTQQEMPVNTILKFTINNLFSPPTT